MVGWRVRRGFLRLGLVIAVPAFVVAVAIAAFAGLVILRTPEWIDYPLFPDMVACADIVDRDARQECQERLYGADIKKYDETHAAWRAAQAPYENLQIAIIWATGGAIWLICCWAIGWVLSGFARDDEAS